MTCSPVLLRYLSLMLNRVRRASERKMRKTTTTTTTTKTQRATKREEEEEEVNECRGISAFASRIAWSFATECMIGSCRVCVLL